MFEIGLTAYAAAGLFVAISLMGFTDCDLDMAAYAWAAVLWPVCIVLVLLLVVLGAVYKAAARLKRKLEE